MSGEPDYALLIAAARDFARRLEIGFAPQNVREIVLNRVDALSAATLLDGVASALEREVMRHTEQLKK